MPDFRGQHFIIKDGELRLGDASDDVRKDVKAFVDSARTRDAQARRRAFLLALAAGSDGRVDFYGDEMSFPTLLSRMRDILGQPTLPVPQDYPLATSLGLYFKDGSNNYPTHCMPPEIVPVVRGIR